MSFLVSSLILAGYSVFLEQNKMRYPKAILEIVTPGLESDIMKKPFSGKLYLETMD